MNDENLRKDRRRFLTSVGHGSLLLGLGGLGTLSLDYLAPNATLEPMAEVNVGRPDEYAPGSVTLLSKEKVFVIRGRNGPLHALSAVCTHLGCITGFRSSAGLIACPCHGSEFDPKDGSVISGPAPKPLPSFEIRMSDQGALWVDRMTRVDPGTILKV